MGRRAATFLSGALLLLGTPPLAAADAGLTMTAEAGLGGVCRAGRWAPVRVAIENRGSDVAGEIVVEWGDATVRRRVDLAAPSRDLFELYVRTADPRGSVTVRLQSNGVEVRALEVPVRFVAFDGEPTICVTSTGTDPSDGTRCDATLSPRALPRAMRGYDAAGGIVWRAGPESVLDAEQQRALAHWRSYRALDDTAPAWIAAAISRPPVPSDRAPGALRAIVPGAAVYVVLLIVIGVVTGRARRRPVPAYVAMAVLITTAAATVLAAGRMGPGSKIVVRSASRVVQLPGAGALISMRGVVEYPRFDRFQIRADTTDATFDPLSVSGAGQSFDEHGYPLLAGEYGLGASQEFSLDAVIEDSLLAVEARGQVVRVTNVSPFELRDCRFPAGFSVEEATVLKVHQSIEAHGSTSDAPVVTCAVTNPLIGLTDLNHRLQIESMSIVAALIPSAPMADRRP